MLIRTPGSTDPQKWTIVELQVTIPVTFLLIRARYLTCLSGFQGSLETRVDDCSGMEIGKLEMIDEKVGYTTGAILTMN